MNDLKPVSEILNQKSRLSQNHKLLTQNCQFFDLTFLLDKFCEDESDVKNSGCEMRVCVDKLNENDENTISETNPIPSSFKTEEVSRPIALPFKGTSSQIIKSYSIPLGNIESSTLSTSHRHSATIHKTRSRGIKRSKSHLSYVDAFDEHQLNFESDGRHSPDELPRKLKRSKFMLL